MRKLIIRGLVLLVVGVAAIYALAGFLGAPPFVRGVLTSEIQRLYHREARIGAITLNPFTGTLQIRDMHVPDEHGEDAISFELLEAQLSPTSMWRNGLALEHVRLSGPIIHLAQRADGTLNLADFIPPPGPEANLPLRIWTDELSITNGRVDFVDLSRAKPLKKSVGKINIRMTGFETPDKGIPYELDAAGDGAEKVGGKGVLRVSPPGQKPLVTADGTFDVKALKLPVLAAWAGEAPYTLASGEMDLAASYAFRLDGTAASMSVGVPAGEIRNIAIQPSGTQANWLKLKSLAFKDVKIDLGQRSVEIADVALTAPYVYVAIDKAGAVNLSRLVPPPAEPADKDAPKAADWRVSAPHITLAQGYVDIEDLSQAKPVSYKLIGVAGSADGLALPTQKPVALALATGVNESGKLSAKGNVSLSPLAADLAVQADAIDLLPLQAYLDATTGVVIKSGSASAAGQATFTEAGGLAFAGDASIDRLSTADATSEDLIRWTKLSAARVELKSQPFSLHVGSIGLQDPYAKLVITKDMTINLADVLAPSSKTPAPAAPSAKAEAVPVSIGLVHLDNGSIDFTDHSVAPAVAMQMQQLAGDIRGLSGNPKARAEVKLQGTVDRYATAAITGTANLSPDTYTDVAIALSKMQMTSLSPYSGRFAGYQVRRGALDAKLRYRIDARKIDADHHLIIDNLELGDKVESKDALDLPVPLAVAMLKNQKGVIDIDVPVKGSLDDPDFRLDSVIWKTVGNVLSNVIASPFAMLGSLVGGGEDIQYVDFMPGQSALDAKAMEKLASLRKALIERPGISIEVPMTVDKARDPAVLKQVKLEAMVAAVPPPPPSAAMAADPNAPRDARLMALEQVYAKLYGAPPTPRTPADEVAARTAWLEQQCSTKIELADGDIDALGRARASAVQDALLAGAAVDAGRVYIALQSGATDAKGPVRMRLAVMK